MPDKIAQTQKHAGRSFNPIRSPAEFGRLIRSVRKQQGLTLEAVYAGTGLTTRFLSEFERGKSNASLGGALQAARALGLEVVVLSRAELQQVKAALKGLPDTADRPQ